MKTDAQLNSHGLRTDIGEKAFSNWTWSSFGILNKLVIGHTYVAPPNTKLIQLYVISTTSQKEIDTMTNKTAHNSRLGKIPPML